MKRTALRPMSRKRAAERQQRAAVREQVFTRDGGCVLAGVLDGTDGPCWGPLDCHEILTRGRGGSHLDPDNCTTLCRFHHQVVTENPEWAHTVGLVKHSWEK